MKLPAVVATIVTCAVVAATSVAEAGDPTLSFYTIETEHFVIHYYSRLESTARRLGVVAERAHRR
jgi:hypothetical protein